MESSEIAELLVDSYRVVENLDAQKAAISFALKLEYARGFKEGLRQQTTPVSYRELPKVMER